MEKSNQELQEELNQHPIVEQRDSIKVTKNSAGFNYEFRLVAKNGEDLLKRVDYINSELTTRIKKWKKQEK